ASHSHNPGMASGPLTVKPKERSEKKGTVPLKQGDSPLFFRTLKGTIEVALAFLRVDPQDELAKVRPLAFRDCRGVKKNSPWTPARWEVTLLVHSRMASCATRKSACYQNQ